MRSAASSSTMQSSSVPRPQSTPPEIVNNYRIEHRRRGKSTGLSDRTIDELVTENLSLSKHKSQFFERKFALRKPLEGSKDRAAKDSIIILDVKTNVALEGCEQFIHGDLSFALSEIYQRPASCIMIMMTTGIKMLFQGTTEPAYHLTVTAAAIDIAPTKNKRNAFLIQKSMHDALNISPDRGMVKFEPISEENLATNGITVLQELGSREKIAVGDATSGLIDRRKSQMNRVSSSTALSDVGRLTTPTKHTLSNQNGWFQHRVENKMSSVGPGSKMPRAMKKRKSVLSFFGI